MAGLEDLYREIILDHYRNPRNRGELPSPPAHRVEGFNPLCGDQLHVYLQVEGDRVNDISFEGTGCAIWKASASMMTQAVKGKSEAEAESLFDEFHRMVTGQLDEEKLPAERADQAERETADADNRAASLSAAGWLVVERGILPEDRPLERLQLAARLEAQPLDHRSPAFPIDCLLSQPVLIRNPPGRDLRRGTCEFPSSAWPRRRPCWRPVLCRR